mgnify:CR=1 FL=1
MPAFTTKAASAANRNIVEHKHIERVFRLWSAEHDVPWRNLKARRSAAIAKRTSAKAERKQAKQNLRNY